MNQIDQLIITHIMKWTPSRSAVMPPNIVHYEDQTGKTHSHFSPSTTIQDAWLALDKVCEDHNWRAIIDRNQTDTQIHFKNQMGADMQLLGYRESTTLAICEVVLSSIGVNLDNLLERNNLHETKNH